jgi:phosphoribosylanthranilate isomerase
VALVPSPFASGFVKICGVTSVDDAKFVVSSGASALGLILAESSRQLTLDQAREIAHATRGDLLRVAVFRGHDDDFIVTHVDALQADVAQVHGHLSEGLAQALRDRSVLIVKALGINEQAFQDFDETTVDAVLIDGPRPGSGVTYDVRQLNERVFRGPVIAAGGLTPGNVGNVIATTSIIGVDCSTGVERRPGTKDPELVDAFVTTARAAFRARGLT